MITRHAILSLMFSVHGITISTMHFVIEIGPEMLFPSSVGSQVGCCTSTTCRNRVFHFRTQ